MSISVQTIVGTVVSKLIERNRKDIRVVMLIAEDGREILIRPDKSSSIDITSFFDQKVSATGVIDGSVFIPHEITRL